MERRSKRTLLAVPLGDGLVVEEPRGRVDDDEAAFDVDRGHEGAHEGHHDAPVRGRHEQEVLGGARGQATHGAENLARGRACLKPCQLVGVPGVLLLVLLDEQAGATQRLGILTRGAFLEGREHAVLMRAHGANGQRQVTREHPGRRCARRE